MKRSYILGLAAATLLLVTNSIFAQGFTVNIEVDENGHGTLVNSDGFFAVLQSALLPDPGPGGLASVLTYDLLNPPGLVSGDVFMEEGPGGPILDVIRFNAGEQFPDGGLGVLLFYSDNVDGFDSLADTFGPPTEFYQNTATIVEIGDEINNGAYYTPTEGQPGFVNGASGPVTYHFISDNGGVPEPSTIALLGLGVVALVASRWSKRK